MAIIERRDRTHDAETVVSGAEYSALNDLAELLMARVGGAGDPAAPLLALAALDPASAARWILASDRSGALSRSTLTRVLSTLAEACAASPAPISREQSLQLFRRYGHLLDDGSATELAAAVRSGEYDSELDDALRVALERAPTAAGLLRSTAELARGGKDYVRAHALLTRLGQSDSGLATAQFVYGTRRRMPRGVDSEVRIALLSSFTIDPLVPYLDLECRALRLEPSIRVAPFNTWEREMLGEHSALQEFQPQLAFLSAAADDLLPELAGAPSADELARAGAAAVDRILVAAEHFAAWSSGVLVVHALHSAHRDPLGSAAGRVTPSRAEVMNQLNGRLAEGLRAIPRTYLLELPDVLARRRRGTIDQPKMRHLASMRLSEHVLEDVAKACARFVAPVMGRTRKCVVVDLDNTLWGGIVGEDGPHGIRLGHASPGSEYVEFQQYLQSLTRRGMLLAIISKNNEADALEVIRSHDAMVLRETAFCATRINWESKANNMLSLAAELNLGLDAFVFVDDNEKERALMRQALPQVLTPDLPRDPSLYRETLEGLAELQVLAITEEDLTRTKQYAERRKRESLRVSAHTVNDYLQSLAIVAETDVVSEKSLARVHQLFQRTNQFNLAGRRYEMGTLAARMREPDWRLYGTTVGDRFGEHGLVASAVVRLTAQGWHIDNLVMSCRVIGYGVEDALLARIAADAREAGVGIVRGDFIASPKNAPAADFYARNVFQRAPTDGPAECWERDVATNPLRAPAWISVSRPHDT